MNQLITIDGPGGAGKGTISRLLAARLGWSYLDSGALYRAVAVYMVKQRVTADAPVDQLAALALNLPVVLKLDEEHGVHVMLEGRCEDEQIRSEQTAVLASTVAAIPAVRQALLQRQRRYAEECSGLVADGRDMGTVVFPQAPLKIFLTATLDVRAKRRVLQLKDAGGVVTIARIRQQLAERDQRDRERPVGALIPADDAHVVDCSQMTVEDVLAGVLKIWHTLN